MTTTSFFEGIKAVRTALSLSTSVNERWNLIRNLLDDADISREFWNLLDSPEWIPLLRNGGFFNNPQPVERLDSGGVRYPKWPPSSYLARMAEHAPDLVTAIFLEIETDNWAIAHDVVDAAKEMPGDYSTQLVPKIIQWIKDKVLWHDLDDIAKLCDRLVKRGQVNAAVELMRGAFRFDWANEDRQVGIDSDYLYIRGIEENVIATFASVCPGELLEHLFSELRAGIKVDRYVRDATDNDASFIWRPAIEDHEQNSDFDTKSKLVGCVVKALKEIIEDSILSLDNVMKMLERENYLVFKRIRLHLIRVFAHRNKALAQKTMVKRNLFNSAQEQHEYAMLVHDRFSMLSNSDQSKWFGWVDGGPEGFDQNCFDAKLGADERERQTKWWQYEKLSWVKPYLKGKRLDLVKEMESGEREPGQTFFSYYSSGVYSVSLKGPFTVEMLSNMGFEEAVAAVDAWQQPASTTPHEGPSYEGLAETFEKYCATEPEKVSVCAMSLKGRRALYVRSYLKAISKAIGGDKEVDIGAVLKLCLWVVQQPVDQNTSPADGAWGLIDKNWQWTWDRIAELIEVACEANISQDHRPAMWEVIKRLTKGGEVAGGIVLSDESDVRFEDYATYSLNSSRGKAMTAVMAYAHWFANTVAKGEGNRKIVEGGFGQMSEVQELIEEELSSDDGSGIGSRAVYGRHIGLLYWIDSKWLNDQAEKIFDIQRFESDRNYAHGWAAWNTFLRLVQPHIEFYRILANQFSYAVDQAAQIRFEERKHDSPFDRLGEHLMILYGRGDLGLEDDQKIIQRLLAQAARPVRTHAITYVGRSFRKYDGEVPPEVLDRFQRLWEWYWKEVGEEDAKADAKNWAFGWWFVCGVFDDSWSLKQLQLVTDVAPKPEPDSLIVERLVDLCGVDPVATVKILKNMVAGDDEGWRVYSWKKEAKKVLDQVMNTSGDARNIAEEVIDILGRRGYEEFGELLGG